MKQPTIKNNIKMNSFACKKPWVTLFLSIAFVFSHQAKSQKLLVHTRDTLKIKSALQIVKQFEPEIYSKIINRVIIQFGIIPDKPGINFAISDEVGGKIYHWIMLNPILMNGFSNDIIACILVHEAMHLGFDMSFYNNIETDNTEVVDKHEHTIIYNYELTFLKKIGASKGDIESRKQIMKQLSIPII